MKPVSFANHVCIIRPTCFSSGNGPYYRYHHGENKLSPRQQEDIIKILANYGNTEGLAFDHYEMDYDFY